MKPLEWQRAQHDRFGHISFAARGPLMRACVWYSDAKGRWAWEVDFGGPHGDTVIDYAPTEEEAKKAADQYLRGVIQMLAGDGAK